MVKRLLDFLNASPVNFLAAKNIASYLEQAGYRRLDPRRTTRRSMHSTSDISRWPMQDSA